VVTNESPTAALAIVRQVVGDVRRLMQQAIDACDAEWLRELDERWDGVMPLPTSDTSRQLKAEADAIRFALLADAHWEARRAAGAAARAPLLQVLARHFGTFAEVQQAACARLAQLAAEARDGAEGAERATSAVIDVTAVTLLAAMVLGEDVPAPDPLLLEHRESLKATVSDLSRDDLGWRVDSPPLNLQQAKAAVRSLLDAAVAPQAS
jgi:hypothetical protein